MATIAAAMSDMNCNVTRLGLLAHDLRTPLSCISGAAQMALLSAQSGARVEDYLKQILSAVNALNAMTGELLREEAIAFEAFEGDALERELRVLIAPQAEARGQHLVLDMGALAGRRFAGDASALTRVLTNLLTNAVKYTQRGGEITLTAELVRRRAERGTGNGVAQRRSGGCEDDAPGGRAGGRTEDAGGEITAVFTVRDNGAGMAQAFVEKMYQPFARAQETAQEEGHGLGLASVKRLVAQMNGTIDVSSHPGEGTVFTVRVPLRRLVA